MKIINNVTPPAFPATFKFRSTRPTNNMLASSNSGANDNPSSSKTAIEPGTPGTESLCSLMLRIWKFGVLAATGPEGQYG